MNTFIYSAKTAVELHKELRTSFDFGLSPSEAEQRLHRHGSNEVRAQRVTIWKILLRQFTSPFIYLLLVAAVIVLIAGEYIDGLVIVAFVFINAGLGFYQEYKSERSLQLLQEFVISHATVLRAGKWHNVDSKKLVPGDIVKLKTGDLVPADIRLIECENIMVDEEPITGESIPIAKICDLINPVPADIYHALNVCFSGTTVVRGEAQGIVVGTGRQTSLGMITKLTVETAKESVFSRGIAQFSKFILRMIIITLVVVFAANIIIKGHGANVLELVIFSIALAVSVIPEALPIVSTVSLSRGALQLAKQKVVVKRLTAIEDLGGIDVLCSDKTGTLTENKLMVVGLSAGADQMTLFYAACASGDEVEKIEPFDAAIASALTENSKKTVKNVQRLAEVPFDPTRRRNSVLIKHDGVCKLIVRGAPEDIIGLCGRLTKEKRGALEKWLMAQGQEGKRTIAIAIKTHTKRTVTTIEKDEHDLGLLGIISFEDPIKQSAFRAVKKAKQLGVTVKIITGDSAAVAGAVAEQIGLIEKSSEVMLGSVFMQLSDYRRAQAVRGNHVFARVTPEQKYAIIQTLQQQSEVGFLGEGINDAPSLKLAGVSLAVSSAAGIAREAADIILLKKNLEVIVDGIKHGRTVFANTIKYLKSTLASNFGNFYAIALGSLFISFLPMLPLQILLVNLLSDFPMISIATDNVDRAELARPQKYRIKDIIIIATMLGVISTVFDFMFFGLFFRQGEGILQTNWFIGSILTELVFFFCIRTKLPFFRSVRPSWYILILTSAAFIITIILPYTRIGQSVFRFTPPTLAHLGIILGIVAIYFIVSEMVKNTYYRHFDHEDGQMVKQ